LLTSMNFPLCRPFKPSLLFRNTHLLPVGPSKTRALSVLLRPLEPFFSPLFATHLHHHSSACDMELIRYHGRIRHHLFHQTLAEPRQV
jgi:hypothetical protein